MGIYTNMASNIGISSDYRSVEPFSGESFNYHELGIIAASEMAMNHNSFMKAIALNELAAYEQTGSTNILYESVDFKSIFNKIKMFFQKIIEKIHKIFHTFIAKMSSWFGDTSKFATKYDKEIVSGWQKVKDDFEYKGYDYSKALKVQQKSSDFKTKADKADFNALLNGDIAEFAKNATSDLPQAREKLDDVKNSIRKQIITTLSQDNVTTIAPSAFSINFSSPGEGLESNDYTKELFKVFRNNQDEKTELNKSAIEKCYGGNITSMVQFLKDFSTTKKNLETSEKAITDKISNLIKKIESEQDKLINKNSEKAKSSDADKDTAISTNEKVIQGSTIYQNVWNSISESITEAFTALLQANKDAATQAKAIATKVIGQGKKITTNESYDYSTSTDGGFSFIDSVKLV